MKFSIILFALLLPVGALAQVQKDSLQKPSLVVFVVGMGNGQLSNYFTNLIGNNLAKAYTIVPRTEAVKRKLQELKAYEDAGHIDDRQLMEWGRQNNVSVLCLVTVARVYEYMFSAQLTDVKNNTLIGNAEYEIPSLSSEDLKKAASALAAQIQRKKNN
jgi:hypothetical protein